MAARGLDVPGIEHIVNFDLPNDGVDPGEFPETGLGNDDPKRNDVQEIK